MEDLHREFGELHELVVSRGLACSIAFDVAALGKIDTDQEAAKPRECLDVSSLSPDQLRRTDVRGLVIGEKSMYMLICACCFKVGTPFPVLAGKKATVQELQAPVQRKLIGLDGGINRLFQKCWAKMSAEGAIGFNTNKSAASLNLTARVRDYEVGEALRWASHWQGETRGQDLPRARVS